MSRLSRTTSLCHAPSDALFPRSDAADVDYVKAIDSGPVPVGVEWRDIVSELTGKKGKKTKARLGICRPGRVER